MLWLALWIVVLALGAVGLVASANSLRFGRRVRREAQHMWTDASEPLPIDRRRLEELPPTV